VHSDLNCLQRDAVGRRPAPRAPPQGVRPLRSAVACEPYSSELCFLFFLFCFVFVFFFFFFFFEDGVSKSPFIHFLCVVYFHVEFVLLFPISILVNGNVRFQEFFFLCV
jgi:hypothetical protein